MKVLVALSEPEGERIAEELRAEGIDVPDILPAARLVRVLEGSEPLAAADAVLVPAERAVLTAELVAACDRRAMRIVPWGAATSARRLAASLGLDAPLGPEDDARRIIQVLTREPEPLTAEPAPRGPRTVVVWGAAGAPGRTTVAIELATELGRRGKRVGLVDADSHAPSLALALGLPDEGPGFASACRQIDGGVLDGAELSRISLPTGSNGVDVLTGLNRPSRWPELSSARVTGALRACREWVDVTVVDVSASLERDEEVVSDIDGPRRNAATLAALEAADSVVAVVGAEPVGLSRFLRVYPEMRAIIGATPTAVLANRLRPGAVGLDARGQVRRTLDRFGGIEDVWFAPLDLRAVDAALLQACAVSEVAPRSAFASAMRRFVSEAVDPPHASTRRARRRRRDLVA